jgi:hypothetical protein
VQATSLTAVYCTKPAGRIIVLRCVVRQAQMFMLSLFNNVSNSDYIALTDWMIMHGNYVEGTSRDLPTLTYYHDICL